MTYRKEPFTLSYPPGDALTGGFKCCLPGARDHAALAVTWSMATWAPYAGSSREPELGSSEEQAKLPGWGLRPLSRHLRAPKDCTSMEQELETLALVLALLKMVGLFPRQKEERGFETGAAILPDHAAPE